MPPSASPPPALSMHSIAKHFGAVSALDGAELVVRPGTVHALLGENGAGKTTLMRIAFGMLRPDAGTVAVGGGARRFKSPREAIAAGVGMVHQHFALVPAMTVAENVALGLSGRFDARAAAERVTRIAAETGLALDPAATVAGLPVETQQRLEIVKALARSARLLILDEPTAVLAPAAATDLLRWLRQFATGDRSVVLITHKLREALAIADEVTVLRQGRTVLATRAAGATESSLAAAMLGTPGRTPSPAGDAAATVLGTAERPTPPKDRPAGAPVIVADRISLTDARGVTRIADASFAVWGGEIVGIAAVQGGGEGQHDLLRALAGRLGRQRGDGGEGRGERGRVEGDLRTPAAVGFVPEDRQRDALVMEFPIFENVALRGAGTRRGRMAWGRVRAETKRLLDAFDVRAAGVRSRAFTLSGGNQQKLVLARELDGRPAALVVENPTRGLDIQAAAAVHERLREARAQGTAVVVYSSDVDEVLALADRVLVVSQRTVREVPLDREAVGRGVLGLG